MYHRGGQNDYKNHFSKRIDLVQLICKNYKPISLQSKFLRIFFANRDKQWQQHYKENALVELFL